RRRPPPRRRLDRCGVRPPRRRRRHPRPAGRLHRPPGGDRAAAVLSRRRRGERGQALLIALAFLGLFTLWGVAVLRLAGASQGSLGAATAVDDRHALAEGPAVFARSAVA